MDFVLEVNQVLMILKVWTVTRIKASLRSKKIVITDKSIALDMHDFLIRGAKKK